MLNLCSSTTNQPMLFSIIGVIKNKSGVSLFELTGTYNVVPLLLYAGKKNPKNNAKWKAKTHAKALLRFTNI